MAKPLFSILVPTYNQAHFLSAALDSLINQSFQDWEAVVVNDGSEDNTADVIEQYCRKEPRIKGSHKENGGVSSALNTGLDNVNGKWVCWLSSDDLFEPDALEKFNRQIVLNPQFKFFHFDYSTIEENGDLSTKKIHNIDRVKDIPPYEFQTLTFFQGNYIHGITVVIAKEVFDKTGYFDETIRYASDFDMWLRISRLYKTMYINERVAISRVHGASDTGSFYDAGIFDSARSLLNFLNNHTFNEIFPNVNFCDHTQILNCLQRTLNLCVNLNSYMYQGVGYVPALIDRMNEWLSCSMPDVIKESLVNDFEKIIQSVQASALPVPLKNAFIKMANLKDNKFNYQKYDIWKAFEDNALNLENVGQAENAQIIRKYLEKLSKYRYQVKPFPKEIKKADKKYVNIVIVTYNRSEYTKQCIENLMKYTEYPHTITVVDNNSSDGTKEYLRELFDRKIIKNLVLLQENIGVAKAANIGWVLEPNAEYYLKFDNDIVILKSKWLDNLVDTIENIPQLGAVAYNFEPVSYPASYIYNRSIRIKEKGNLGGACILIPAKTFKMLGYWSEEYGLYGEEDADYCHRIRLTNQLIAYMDDEDIGLHLPGGKAALINENYEAEDDSELAIYHDYRIWKDKLRKSNVLEGKYRTNIGLYDSAQKNIYMQPEFALNLLNFSKKNINSLKDILFINNDFQIYKNKNKVEVVNNLENEKKYDVSIVIPVFNNIEYTRQCIDSVYRLSGNKYNYDIIVVDNASVDGTNAYLEELARQNENFSFITNSENLGFAKAVNQGIKRSRSEFVVLLNNDTIVTDNWLEALVDSALTDDKIGIVGSLLVYPGAEEIIQHCGVMVAYYNGALMPYHIHKLRKLENVPSALISKDMKCVTAACMLVKRTVVEEIGYLNENFKNSFEDVDFCLRVYSRGYKVHYCGQSKVVHYESKTPHRNDNDLINLQLLQTLWNGKILEDETFEETKLNIWDMWCREELLKEPKAIEFIYKLVYLCFARNEIKDAVYQMNNFNELKPAVPEPDFSIIIPVLNNWDYTLNCLDALEKCDKDTTFEVIVVDNDSAPDTKLKLFEENKKRTNLKVLFNLKNESYAIANNQGAAAACGKYLLFLNNDTQIFPDALTALKKTFENDDKIGIQGGKLLYPNNTIQHCGIVFGEVAQNLNLHYHIYLTQPSDATFVNKAREYQMVTGAMLAVRKDVFGQVEKFDENYYFGHEDLDLCMKVRQAGFKVWYNPLAAAYHFESITKKLQGIDKFERYIHSHNSYDAQNDRYFHSKWDGILNNDADDYYIMDGFLHLVKEKSKLEIQSQTIDEKSESLSPENRKMKVLNTMYGWNESGGGTIFPKHVCLQLAKEGIEVASFYATAYHDNRQPYYMEIKEEQGVKLYGVYNRATVFLDSDEPLREIRDEHVIELFKKVLDEFQPDVIHFQNFLGLSFAMAEEAKMRGIATVYTPHNYHLFDPNLYMFNSDLEIWKSTDLFENSELIKRFPAKREEYEKRVEAAKDLIKNNIDITLAVSTRVKDLLIDFGADENKITVVNQVNEITNFLSEQVVKADFVHKPIRFGFIGSVIPQKGVHNLVLAAQLIPKGLAEFYIYGSGNEVYIEQMKKFDKHGQIIWKGAYQLEDLPKIAEELDVAIVPSVWEDCAPLVVAENLSMKLPVIAANIGGISDFVIDNYNGRLYNYNSIRELANIIKEIVDHPEKISEWRKNINNNITFNDYIQNLKKVYSLLIDNNLTNPEVVELKYHKPKPVEIEETTEPIAEEIKADKSEIFATESESTVMNRLQFGGELPGGFSNSQANGILPEILPSPLYLNLGCGKDIRDDFLNLDLYSSDPRVIFMDIRRLEFEDNTVDEILASDILEHFSHRETDSLLAEWCRVLKPGAELIIRCPSLSLQIKAYNEGKWDADIASYMIFGGQTNPGDYHCVGFDEKSIKLHLLKAGLEVIDFQEFDIPQEQGFINLNMQVRALKPRLEEKKEKKFNIQSTGMFPVLTDTPPHINIIWEGSQFVWHSLALINREHCSNIIDSNLAELTIVPYEPDQFSPQGNEKFEKLARHDIRIKPESSERNKQLPYLWIRHQWPPKFEEPKGSKWVIMQPWEFTALRKDFVELFAKADEIWTPSNYSRNCMVNSGVDFNKVQVVPNGIDPKLFTPVGDKYPIVTEKRFKFLYVGGTIYRKGIDILISAYTKAFKKDDDVVLVIKDMGGDSFYSGQTAKQYIEALRKEPNAPEIYYIDEYLSEEQMTDLYRACDVFVSPYRGEGFSLPTLEAMACGLPVVVTEGGATDDFVDSSFAWFIPAGMKSVGNNLSGYELSGEAFLLEPDENYLAEILTSIIIDPSMVAVRGIKASQRARTLWTWNRATIKMFSRIDALYGSQMAIDAEKSLLDLDDDPIYIGIAENMVDAGDYETAFELYRQVIDNESINEKWNVHCIIRCAELFLLNGQIDEAENEVVKAESIIIDSPDIRYLRVKIHIAKGEIDDALDYLTDLMNNWVFLKYDTTISITLEDLLGETGNCFILQQDYEGALKLFTQMLKINPDSANGCLGAAKCFYATGNTGEAKNMLEWTLKLNPALIEAHDLMEQIKK